MTTTPDLPAAEAVMAKAGRENFPVASRFLPRDIRADLMAVYGFARLVDDLGDEAQGDRLGHLAWLEAEVTRAYEGHPTHPLLRRLQGTIGRRAIPAEPFRKLIEANRVDQVVSRYETFQDLLAYCALSADPVGHIVLHVLGRASPSTAELSDAVCSGLQLVEHWQDVREDLERGRVYLPAEDLERFGVTERDLAAPRAGLPFRALMAHEVARARDLLARGAPLAGELRGRPGLAVAGFVAGGRAALDAIEEAGHDVLAARPRPGRAMRGREFLLTLRGSGWRW